MREVTDKNFIDWFAEHFPFGYGIGEQHILPKLKAFLENCPKEGNYDYQEIEKKIGEVSTWFLINPLCGSNCIEYGTSPRFGWLDKKGVLLKEYVSKKTADELYELVMVDSDYTHCSSTYCNCGENGFEEGRKCDNPLF